MDSCDVLIVGGGPAGSSCAWKLRNSGLDVVVIDKASFPRHKVCGGWITPAVLTELEIDPAEYAKGRTLQPITAFRTGTIGGSTIETNCDAAVSYGIRRCEFDDYLLRRARARLLLGTRLRSLERSGDQWIANGHIRARMLVGAGGHFCPVAHRLIRASENREDVVVAQEAEFEMNMQQLTACRVQPETPELYFCSDMKGYGWCFRKENFLNIGLGRMDRHRLTEHLTAFISFLRATGRIAFDLPKPVMGHAYLLYGSSHREIIDDCLLLIGDAAGLAYRQSGEGIRPSIESGLLAADAIRCADGNYAREVLESYRTLLQRRFGTLKKDWSSALGEHLPDTWVASLGRRLLRMRWFTRAVVIDRWFLHKHHSVLAAHGMACEVEPSIV
jgi:menaquinone-9 beta-reductase